MKYGTSLIILCIFFCLDLAGQNSEAYQHLSYRNLGPTRGGRATAVAGHVNHPGTFLMGATGGGVWCTKDYGQNWSNISDGYFSTPSIGAIRIAPSADSIIYVGTGTDGIRSNVIIGKGMYKSSDGGDTWTDLGLKKAGQIGAVIIHPENPDRVFAAALGNPFAKNKERGVYRTSDGGVSWQHVLFHSDSVGAVDLEFHPTNPEVIYACMWRAERKPWTIISGGQQIGGIYKSVDGGDTWKKLAQGLPSGLIGKSDLAVSPADPDVLWALVEAPQEEGGVFKSTDSGENFALVSTKKELLDRPFYYCNIDANPQNANSLFINSTAYWLSHDGGQSWKKQRTPHGDNHDLWINPQDTLLQIQSNDGGANVTRDGGQSWSSIKNQSTAELYQVNVDDQTPYWLYAGQQDNSTISIPSLPPHNAVGGASSFWTAVGGCETGPAVPKPGSPHIVYSNCKGRFGTYNKLTGQEQQFYVGASNMYGHNPRDLKFRFQRVSPIHISPHNPNVVYHASQYVHKTTDDGRTWQIISPDLTAFTPETQKISGSPITRDITGEEFYSTIYCVQESPIAPGTIWTGANDGPIHVTSDSGANWSLVTPPALLPGGRVQTVEASPHQAEKAYACVLRYQLGDFKPYLFRTNDLGKSWTLLSKENSGIPTDHPVRVVREDPSREGLLYAGTEFGMFISFDDGVNWQPFQQNLPITPITDIKVHQNDLVLSTMGRGFWIMDDVTSLHALKTETALYPPTPDVMLRYRSTGSKSIPNYGNPGLAIDYHLATAPTQIDLQIALADGTPVRRFTTEKPEKEEEEVSMATGFRTLSSTGELSAEVGSHRLIWDYRHEGYKPAKGRSTAGPRVAPGEYQITLTVDGQRYQQTATLLPDPRIIKSGISIADLQSQEELALQVFDTRKQAEIVAHSLSKLIKDDLSQSQKAAIDALLAQLKTTEGRYHKPMLLDQLRYLYSMITRADQAPGQDASERYIELEKEFSILRKKAQKFSRP